MGQKTRVSAIQYQPLAVIAAAEISHNGTAVDADMGADVGAILQVYVCSLFFLFSPLNLLY